MVSEWIFVAGVFVAIIGILVFFAMISIFIKSFFEYSARADIDLPSHVPLDPKLKKLANFIREMAIGESTFVYNFNIKHELVLKLLKEMENSTNKDKIITEYRKEKYGTRIWVKNIVKIRKFV